MGFVSLSRSVRYADCGVYLWTPNFYLCHLFSQFGPVTISRMFSGAGIFADGLMFGLIVDGAIHLKVDETNIADFEREGSRPFTYTRGKSSGRPTRHALPYWRLPDAFHHP